MCIYQFWPLNDWVEVIGTCQSCMNDLERFRQRAPLNPSQEIVETNTNDLSLQALLYKALHGLTKQSKGTAMLHNLQTAAFHLSFMLRGFKMSDKLVSISFVSNHGN
jgi:hypothetical protein